MNGRRGGDTRGRTLSAAAERILEKPAGERR